MNHFQQGLTRDIRLRRAIAAAMSSTIAQVPGQYAAQFRSPKDRRTPFRVPGLHAPGDLRERPVDPE
jgi:hypothetical protein